MVSPGWDTSELSYIHSWLKKCADIFIGPYHVGRKRLGQGGFAKPIVELLALVTEVRPPTRGGWRGEGLNTLLEVI